MQLEAACPSCASPITADSRFCPSCGTAIGIAGEDVRKTVTLLFCDVSGSTALGEELDPEVLRSVMGRYFAIAKAAVERHGGTVEKFVGDAVLAVFGIPLVREDDALRAVRAAIEMRDELAELSTRLEHEIGVRLMVRTGVNTGSVVAGSARSGGSFATGDAVNTAARLEQAAHAGEVLMGFSTYQLVRDAVEVEQMEPLAAKGKAELLTAYRLLRVLAVDGGRTRRVDTELVGRERELHRLDEALEMVIADRRCQLVTVLGPAGMGKTRLLADFVATREQTCRFLTGRCLSYGTGITYWPVMSVVRQAVGLTDEEDEAIIRNALSGAVVGLAEGVAVVGVLAPLLGCSGDLSGPGETSWAVRSLLEHLAETQPLVVVIEDIHWAEPVLLELIEHLRDELGDVALMIVCLARPELLDDRPGWGGGAMSSMTLLLERLGRDQTASLIAGLLGPGVPVEVADAVNRLGDGNPLFLEEVTTHLVEEGLLIPSGEGWSLSGDITAMSVPPTVTALLAARLDRLPSGERSVLERASVIGLEVTKDALSALAIGGGDPSAALASLTRKNLLRRVKGASSEAFIFRHVLVREAAYDALSKAQRATLHEGYADRLLDHRGDAGSEIDAFIGHHLEQAARLRRELSPGTPEAELLAGRAADALAIAAERANLAGDSYAVEQLMLRSLDLTSTHSVEGRRKFRSRVVPLVRAQMELDQFAKALVNAERGLALSQDNDGELIDLVLTTQKLANQLSTGADLDLEPLRRAVAEASERARAESNVSLLCQVLYAGTKVGQMAGQWEELEHAATEIREVGQLVERNAARVPLCVSWIYGPRPHSEALALFDAIEPWQGASRVATAFEKVSRAVFLAGSGMTSQARDTLQEGRDLLGDDRWTQGGSLYAFFGAYAERLVGDDDLAVASTRAGIDFFRAAGGLSYVSTLLGILAALLAERGDDEGATLAVDEAAALTARYDTMSNALVHTVRGVLASRQGHPAEAQRLSELAIATVMSSDQIDNQGDVHRWLAEIPARRGDTAEQRRLLEEAARLFRAKGNVPLAERVQLELAELAGTIG